MSITPYRVNMEFENGTRYSFIEENGDEWLRVGKWSQPYPNTEEDSIVFGLLEAYGQSEGPLAILMWQVGEPLTVEIAEV